MKRVHDRVNIIPVIAKADTLTKEECERFKKTILREIKQHDIRIYDFPEDEDDDEEDNRVHRELKSRSVQVNFDDEGFIYLEGPPEEVKRAENALSELTQQLQTELAFDIVKVHPNYHRHIIGKGGSNIARIKDETGVLVSIPDESTNSDEIIVTLTLIITYQLAQYQWVVDPESAIRWYCPECTIQDRRSHRKRRRSVAFEESPQKLDDVSSPFSTVDSRPDKVGILLALCNVMVAKKLFTRNPVPIRLDRKV